MTVGGSYALAGRLFYFFAAVCAQSEMPRLARSVEVLMLTRSVIPVIIKVR
jgi:hypothetical protein